MKHPKQQHPYIHLTRKRWMDFNQEQFEETKEWLKSLYIHNSLSAKTTGKIFTELVTLKNIANIIDIEGKFDNHGICHDFWKLMCGFRDDMMYIQDVYGTPEIIPLSGVEDSQE